MSAIISRGAPDDYWSLLLRFTKTAALILAMIGQFFLCTGVSAAESLRGEAAAAQNSPEQAPPAPPQLPPMHPIDFVEDGTISKTLALPVYEWSPSDSPPLAMVLAIHGLTLHGTSYELTGKAFASGGYYFVSSDMRGFGKCARTFAGHQEYCRNGDCKWKVDYEKSYDDIVRVAQAMKKKYPGLPITVMGESLGCTLAVRIAGEHPELIDRVILSAPAVRLNPLMFFSPASLSSGSYALMISPRFHMSLLGFINNLVSNDPKISKEMLDDPLILKAMPLCDLIKTQECVAKTIKYARKIAKDKPILIVQGGQDHCVIPEAIVKLARNTRSGDQTLKWLDQTGHLLLETHYLKAATIAAINDWYDDHEPAHLVELKAIEDDIRSLGGQVSQ